MYKNLDIWLLPYIKQSLANLSGRSSIPGPRHIVFTIVDHFEPFWSKATYDHALSRVDWWAENYPTLMSGYLDSDGTHPRHSFFYPAEQYDKQVIDMIASICKSGYGEMEVHLHHDNDNEDNLRKELLKFKQVLSEDHGMLSRDKGTGEICYGFIHGNWALDNSRKDGRWCGVNNEISILKETGCYADFTLPSAPHDTQTSTVNSIYYATDDPSKPKSHDCGTRVSVNKRNSGDLMIIQGPLGLYHAPGRFPWVKIENSDLSAENPPSAKRLQRFLRANVQLEGLSNWCFIKLHTHGAQEANMKALFGDGMKRMLEELCTTYNDSSNYRLHFATAREMYNIIKYLEAGNTQASKQMRDYQLVAL